MKSLTIRGVDSEVAEKLKSTAAKQGKSINQLVLECIKKNSYQDLFYSDLFQKLKDVC